MCGERLDLVRCDGRRSSTVGSEAIDGFGRMLGVYRAQVAQQPQVPNGELLLFVSIKMWLLSCEIVDRVTSSSSF